MTKFYAVLNFSFLSNLANAEYFGLPNGGLAALSSENTFSIEAAYSNGSLEEADYSNLGLRASYRALDNLIFFGDIARSNVADDSGTGPGFGAIYDFGSLIDVGASTFFKGSVHKFNYTTRSGGSCSGASFGFNPFTAITGEIDVLSGVSINPGTCTSSSSYKQSATVFAAELLVKGNTLEALTIDGKSPSWYANAGYHSFGDSNIDRTIGFGGGLIYPLEKSAFYFGADFIGELVFSAGLLYKIR